MRISDWSSDVCSSDLRQTKEADRAADLQTWKIKQDYTRENPSAPSDAGLLEWWESLPAERKASYAAMKDVQSPIAVSGPGGTFRVPRQLEQQGGGDLRAQAEAAISGGADPAAVWARYRQMEIGRAHVLTPVTNAHLVCRLLLEKKN